MLICYGFIIAPLGFIYLSLYRTKNKTFDE